MLLQMVDGDFFVGHRLGKVTVDSVDFEPTSNDFTFHLSLTPCGDEPIEHHAVLRLSEHSKTNLVRTLLSWQFMPWVMVHVVYDEDPRLVPDQQPAGWICHQISTGHFVGLVRVS